MLCPIFLIFGILTSLCTPNQSRCAFFDSRTMSVEYYWDNYNGQLPGNCSRVSNLSDFHNVNSEMFHIFAIKGLKLGGCDLSQALRFVNKYENLRALDISYSQYDTLSDFQMKYKNLTKFNTSHNRLIEIPVRLFDGLPGIVEIDFSYNQITTVMASLLKNSVKMTRINLSHNKIFNIETESFIKLINLKFLDLSSNSIVHFDVTLKNNKKLTELHLEHNHIDFYACLDNGPPQPWTELLKMNVVSIYISWQHTPFINLRCIKNRLHVINNSKVEGIIRANQMYELHCNANSFKYFYSFVAAANQFDNIADIFLNFGSFIRKLDVSGNFIGQLNTNTFHKLIGLEVLQLKNTNLMEFDFATLESLNKLEEMDISDNILKNLKNFSILRELNKFRSLYMARTQLEITPHFIRNLTPSLQELDVSGNFFDNTTTFEMVPWLKRLYIKNVNLTIFNLDPFRKLDILQTLDISYNNLGKQNFHLLSQTLQSIVNFYAIDCQIETTTELITLLNPYIERLDLSGNVLKTVKADTFQKFTRLYYLCLNQTQLIEFDFNTFRKDLKLEHFSISNNQLIELNFKTMTDYILEIDLNGNNLTELDSLIVSQNRGLVRLGMSKNNFSCKYLANLVPQLEEWQDLKFIGDPWDQKHGDCHPKNESTTQITTGIKYQMTTQNGSSLNQTESKSFGSDSNEATSSTSTVIIAICSPVAIILFGCMVFNLRRKLCKNITSHICEEPQLRDSADDVREEIEMASVDQSEEHIYEEIGPSTQVYDRLNFECQSPKQDIMDHYDDAPPLPRRPSRFLNEHTNYKM